MDDEDGYFGERVAARYDESLADMCAPGVVDAVVEVLAGLAGGGRALELGHRDRTHSTTACAPRRCGPRRRPLAGDGCPAARQAGRRGDWRDDRRLRDGEGSREGRTAGVAKGVLCRSMARIGHR
jgi:hypothetical protein